MSGRALTGNGSAGTTVGDANENPVVWNGRPGRLGAAPQPRAAGRTGYARFRRLGRVRRLDRSGTFCRRSAPYRAGRDHQRRPHGGRQCGKRAGTGAHHQCGGAWRTGVRSQRARRLAGAYSTDYVFDGSGAQPWQEEDATGPLSTYGVTKLEGEQAILVAGRRHLIFRTNWGYDGSRGGNFAKTKLRLACERPTVIDDQTGAPTGADLLAEMTAHAIRTARHQPAIAGLCHLVASGETTWHYAAFVIDFARRAGMDVKVAPDAIVPVPTSVVPTPARRPANSRLATGKLRNAFGLALPHWQAGVARMLTEILEKQS